MPVNALGTTWTTDDGQVFDLRGLSQEQIEALPMSSDEKTKMRAELGYVDKSPQTGSGNVTAVNVGSGGFDPAGLMGFRPNIADETAPGATLDTKGADAARSQLDPLLQQLQQQATTGDGAWRQAFTQAIERTKANAQAVGQSNPSTGYQSSLRNIANAKGATAQRAVGEEETLRSESMLDARRTLGDTLGAQAQGDIGQAAEAQRVERARRLANQASIDQSLENRKATEKGITGALMSDGGPVPGHASLFGDDERNDTVPAKLSPGEIVIPRSITQGKDAPARAAAFVRAIQSTGSTNAGENFAGGGSPGIRPVSDAEGGGAGVVAANILVPHIGRQIEYNNLRNNVGGGGGGTIDTSQYDETAQKQSELAQLFSGEAQGHGPTITGPMAQRQQDTAIERATAPSAAPMQHQLQALAASGASGAGDVGAQRAREQGSGQQAFAKALQQRRAQEMQLASAKQQAAWEKTLADMGVSAANQQALRGSIAAAGQGAAAFVASSKNNGYHADPDNLTSLSNNPYPEGNPSGGMDPSELETPEFAKGGKVDDERAVTKRLVAAIEQGRKAKPPHEREAKKMSADEAAAFSADMENQYLPQQFVVADRDVMAANAKKMDARGGWRDNFFPRQELQDPYLETEVAKSSPTTVKPLEERPFSTPSIEVKPWKPIYPHGPDGEVMKPYADIEYGPGDGRGPALKEALAETRRMMAEKKASEAGQNMAHGGAADDEAGPPLFMPETGGPTFSYSPADPLGLPERRDAGAQTYTGADLGLGGGFSDRATVSMPAPSDAPPLGAASPSQQLEARRLNMPVATGSAMAPAQQETLVQVGKTPDGLPIVEKRTGEMVPDLKSLKPRADGQAAPAAAKAGAPAGAASAPNFGAKADQTARGAAQAQYDADKANADAQARAAGAQADALESQVLERKATAERVQQRISAAQTRFDAAQQQAANIDTTVDPGRFWASRSTGDRVMGIMGLVLGALGAGPDGVNRAAVMLNQAVDRDIEAQKSEHELRLKKGAAGVDAARSYYAMARDAGQDELAATDLAHAAALRGVVARGQQLVAQTSDPQAKARLSAMLAGVDQGAAQRSTTGWEKAQDRALEREKIDATRAKGATGAAKEVREAQQAYLSVKSTADELKSLIGDTNIVTEKYGKKAARMESLAGSLLLQIKEAEHLGALDKGSVEQAEKIIGDPSATFTLDSTKVAKLNAIIDQAHLKVTSAQAVSP